MNTNQTTERKAFQLRTELQAVTLMRTTMQEHMQRRGTKEAVPAIFIAPPDLARHFERQIDYLLDRERELGEQLRELGVDQAFEAKEPEPPATVAMPQKTTRRRAKPAVPDFGT